MVCYSMEKNYVLYVDPGHAWLRVPLEELKHLGISAQISKCSYRHKEYAYLEEDCDMALFVEAMHKIGRDVQYGERHTEFEQNPIRNCDQY